MLLLDMVFIQENQFFGDVIYILLALPEIIRFNGTTLDCHKVLINLLNQRLNSLFGGIE